MGDEAGWFSDDVVALPLDCAFGVKVKSIWGMNGEPLRIGRFDVFVEFSVDDVPAPDVVFGPKRHGTCLTGMVWFSVESLLRRLADLVADRCSIALNKESFFS